MSDSASQANDSRPAPRGFNVKAAAAEVRAFLDTVAPPPQPQPIPEPPASAAPQGFEAAAPSAAAPPPAAPEPTEESPIVPEPVQTVAAEPAPVYDAAAYGLDPNDPNAVAWAAWYAEQGWDPATAYAYARQMNAASDPEAASESGGAPAEEATPSPADDPGESIPELPPIELEALDGAAEGPASMGLQEPAVAIDLGPAFDPAPGEGAQPQASAAPLEGLEGNVAPAPSGADASIALGPELSWAEHAVPARDEPVDFTAFDAEPVGAPSELIAERVDPGDSLELPPPEPPEVADEEILEIGEDVIEVTDVEPAATAPETAADSVPEPPLVSVEELALASVEELAPVASAIDPPPIFPEWNAAAAEPEPPAIPDSDSYVPGTHRVVIHTADGQVRRGTVTDVALDSGEVLLAPQGGRAAEPLAVEQIKAIFFMLPNGQPPVEPTGRKIRVTFRDGRQVAGFSADYAPERPGFFMVPADARTHTARIWVYRSAVRQVSVS